MKSEIKQRIDQLNNGEIPDGYRKTEFGVFPCDWETNKKLKDIGTFGKGKGIPGDKMQVEGVPCVGYGDIYMKYNHFHFEKAQSFVDEETANDSQLIKKGTLIFTGTGETAGEIGKCVCYNGEENIYAGGDIITFIADQVNPLFIAYQQYQPFSLKKKASFGQGHSVVHIQKENLEKLNVAYPPTTQEQSRIAEILMTWDKAIELQEKIIERMIAKRHSIVQRCFDSEKCTTTIRFADCIVERSERNSTNCNRIKSISNAYGFINQEEQFSKQVASENVSQYKIVKKNYVAYNPSRINVGSIAVYEEEEIGIISPMYTVFECNGIDPRFFLLILNTDRGKYEIKSRLAGSVRDSLAFNELQDIKMNVPDPKEWKKILSIFELFNKTIQLEKDKLDLLKQQCRALQQYLLNGIVRAKT